MKQWCHGDGRSGELASSKVSDSAVTSLVCETSPSPNVPTFPSAARSIWRTVLQTSPPTHRRARQALRAAVVQESAQIRDVTDDTMVHEALIIIWQSRLRLPLPDSHGLLTVRVRAPGTEVSMQGSYVPPFGIAGQVFDSAIGRLSRARPCRSCSAIFAGTSKRSMKPSARSATRPSRSGSGLGGERGAVSPRSTD